MPLGPRVRLLRREAGLTQGAVAKRAGIERSYVSRIENGITALPSPEVLKALAGALGTTVKDLATAAVNGQEDTEPDDERTQELLLFFEQLEALDRKLVVNLAKGLAARRVAEADSA